MFFIIVHMSIGFMIVLNIRMHLRLNTLDTSEYVISEYVYVSFEMNRHTRNAINYWLESINCSTFFLPIAFRLKKFDFSSVIDVNVCSSVSVSN